MENNQLKSFPKSNELYSSGNQLTSLPESFGNLSNLRNLFLEHNQLTSLPKKFGNLNKLHFFFIYNNQLTSLLDSFGDLENLTGFYMFGNLLPKDYPATLNEMGLNFTVSYEEQR